MNLLGKRAGGECTFHVETLQHEELVVAGLVEEGREPGLVPDARVRVAVLQVLVPGYYRDPLNGLEPRRHIRPRRLQWQV